ncbi:MAG: CRTAC1 family protein, partial [Holophagales bacterium]|nr:CRTAC1 family protein [Holophagales bacterium]
DYDDDGDPDLYVSNAGPNRLYRNNGDGTFTDVAPELGVTGPETLSFATWFFDLENDGDLDLFVADYSHEAEDMVAHYLGGLATRRGPVPGRPHLYRNDGGRFREVSAQMGLRQPLLVMGANHGDLDADGFPDLYLGTGDPALDSLVPNVAYRNLGGVSFLDATAKIGLGHLQKGHGVAFGDVDADGDLDLFHQLGGFFPVDGFGNALFENPTNGLDPQGQPRASADWITLRLRGAEATDGLAAVNRFAVGARIGVTVAVGGRERTVWSLVGTGGSFGASSLQAEIGLGRIERITGLEIRWPDAGRTVENLGPLEKNRVYLVHRGQAALPVETSAMDLGAGPPAHRSHPPAHTPTHPISHPGAASEKGKP